MTQPEFQVILSIIGVMLFIMVAYLARNWKGLQEE